MKKQKNKINLVIPTLSVLLFSVLFIFSTAFTKKSSGRFSTRIDTTMLQYYYLELKGTVRESIANDVEVINPTDSATITLSSNGIKLSEAFTNKRGKFSFKLQLGKFYKIEISKKGYATKFFEVKTKVPFDKVEIYSFSVDIDIFEEVKGMDLSVLKKPIAKVAYDLINERFAYDVSYTNRINAEIKKMYKNYYALKKIDDDLMLDAPKSKEAPKQN